MKTKLIKRLFVFVLCAVISVMLFHVQDSTYVVNNAFMKEKISSGVADESKSSDIDLDQDFECDEAIVYIKHQYSVLNKKWRPEDFNISNVREAEDISYINTAFVDEKEYLSNVTFRQILYLKLDTNSKDELAQAVLKLSEMDEVYMAVPDYIQKSEPCSVHPAQQDALQDISFLPNSKAFRIAGLEDAWKVTEGSRDVRVGVIDTGINENKYLSDNLASGFNFAGNNKDTADLFGKSGHGTSVASVIGGAGTGVCKNVSIVPLKIVETNETMKTDKLIRALNYANNNNIRIVNFSYGGHASKNAAAIEAAISDYNGLFVAASGNGRCDLDEEHSYIWYPTELRCDNMITVASLQTDEEKVKKLGVCYYGMKVDIAAPGTDITVIDNKGEVCKGRAGTSFAAPFVTGTAALLLSYNPHLTTMQLKYAILNSADVCPELKSKVASSGCLNIYKALEYVTKGDRVRNYIITNEACSSLHSSVFSCLDLIYPKDLYRIDGVKVRNAAEGGSPYCVSSYTFTFEWKSFTRVFLPYGLSSTAGESIADIMATSRFEKDDGFIKAALSIKKNNCPVKQSYILMGDINKDGAIDTDDSDLLSSILGSGQSSESGIKYCADVDMDGVISRHDLTVLEMYISGEINSLWD